MSTIAQHARVTGFANPHGESIADTVLQTDADRTVALLRVSLGLIMFPHGAQHMLGWFGGGGFGGTLQWMTADLGFATSIAVLAIVTEFFGSIALIAGAFGRLAALGIIGVMVGAASTHTSNGFFMNWFGGLPAGQEGFEYHLLVVLIAFAILIKGSGAWSLDRVIALVTGRRTQ